MAPFKRLKPDGGCERRAERGSHNHPYTVLR